MLKRLLAVVLALVVLGGAAFWWLSAPSRITAAELPTHTADLDNGGRLFWAGGCASCHAGEDGKAANEDGPILSGGHTLDTPFGPIVAPNISPDRTHGIGAWSTAEFATAMRHGVSPEGAWYVPAFPWPSYRGMTLEDLIDLKAFLDTLPASDRANEPGGLAFPFSWRRPIGVWARLLGDLPPVPDGADDAVTLGHYLTVAVGHCGECHTPRTLAFTPDYSRWLAGGVSPEGTGRVPNITPSPDGIGSWTAGDIAYLLESGFTPDFDSVGGDMGPVIDNWVHISKTDRDAVAAYLKAIPPLP